MPITSEPVPIPPFCKRLQIALMVVSTVHVRNMRYVVGRDRQAAAGQLIINIIYLFDNFLWKNISPTPTKSHVFVAPVDTLDTLYVY